MENNGKVQGDVGNVAVGPDRGPRRTLHEHAGAFGKSASTDDPFSFCWDRIRPDWVSDPRCDSPTALYRYFEADGTLLYIGISNQPLFRHDQHIRAEWFPYARYYCAECFPCRRIAEWAEAIMIRAEDPEFNVKRLYAHDLPMARFGWYVKEYGSAPVGVGKAWAKLKWPEGWTSGVRLVRIDQPPFSHPTNRERTGKV